MLKHSAMHGDETPRRLPERTGRHYCVACLAEVGAEEYFRNDHICDVCSSVSREPAAEDDVVPEAPRANAGGE